MINYLYDFARPSFCTEGKIEFICFSIGITFPRYACIFEYHFEKQPCHFRDLFWRRSPCAGEFQPNGGATYKTAEGWSGLLLVCWFAVFVSTTNDIPYMVWLCVIFYMVKGLHLFAYWCANVWLINLMGGVSWNLCSYR